MTTSARFLLFTITIAATAGLVLAQGGAPPAPPNPSPAAPAPAPPAGRGGGRQGVQGAAPARGGGQRRGGFTQFTRELASQDVIVRGKGLYEANCTSCHSVDLRGGDKGTNLLRSGIALTDQHGELVGAAVAKHTPALTRRWGAKAVRPDAIRQTSI